MEVTLVLKDGGGGGGTARKITVSLAEIFLVQYLLSTCHHFLGASPGLPIITRFRLKAS